MVDLSLSADSVNAINRTAQNEFGHIPDRMDLYNGIRGVVDTIVNRTATGGYGKGAVAGDFDSTINADWQFTGVTKAGGWRNLPDASATVKGIVADRLKELAMGAPTRNFSHFENPEEVEKYAARGKATPATLARSQAMLADPNSFSVGAIGNRHNYGRAAGAALERDFELTLDKTAQMVVDKYGKDFDFGSPNETRRAANWDKVNEAYGAPPSSDFSTVDGDTLGYGAPLGGFNFEPTFAQSQDPMGDYGAAAPDVDRGFQSAPQSTGWAGDGGFHGSTPQGFGGFGQTGAVDQGDWSDRGFQSAPQQSSFSPSISDYGFSSMNTTTPAMETLGNQLSQTYRDTAPSFADAPSPTVASDTTGTGQSFNQPTVPSRGYSYDAAPAPAASYSPPSARDYNMGVPDDYSFATPAPAAPVDDMPPVLDMPAAPVPVAPKAPTFATAPVAPKAPAPIAKPPAPIAPPKAPATFSAAPAAQQAAPTPSAPVDFSTAFNGLWGPNAAANRGAFSNQTGMNSATMNALTSAYDSGGMLTGAAYSGLMDAFNNPKTASSPPIDFTANAVQPVFAAPIADLTNLASNPGGNNLDSQGGIVGSYTQGGGLYGGSINDPREMAGYGWGGFGGSSSTDGTNPGLR